MKANDECFAVRGVLLIDILRPGSDRTRYRNRTLAEVQEDPEYAKKVTVERMTLEAFCQSKSAAQDVPVQWESITEERYYDLLECLPPAYYGAQGFLVGEPWDHHAMTGRPRYQACRCRQGVYEASNRPMTILEFSKEGA